MAKLERALHNPEHHASDQKLVDFGNLGVRAPRVCGAEDYATLLAQCFFYDRLAFDQRDENVPGAGFHKPVSRAMAAQVSTGNLRSRGKEG